MSSKYTDEGLDDLRAMVDTLRLISGTIDDNNTQMHVQRTMTVIMDIIEEQVWERCQGVKERMVVDYKVLLATHITGRLKDALQDILKEGRWEREDFNTDEEYEGCMKLLFSADSTPSEIIVTVDIEEIEDASN